MELEESNQKRRSAIRLVTPNPRCWGQLTQTWVLPIFIHEEVRAH